MKKNNKWAIQLKKSKIGNYLQRDDWSYGAKKTACIFVSRLEARKQKFDDERVVKVS